MCHCDVIVNKTCQEHAKEDAPTCKEGLIHATVEGTWYTVLSHGHGQQQQQQILISHSQIKK